MSKLLSIPSSRINYKAPSPLNIPLVSLYLLAGLSPGLWSRLQLLELD